MSLTEIMNKNNLSKKYSDILASNGKTISNANDVMRHIAEIEAMPDYPETVDAYELENIEKIKLKAEAFLSVLD